VKNKCKPTQKEAACQGLDLVVMLVVLVVPVECLEKRVNLIQIATTAMNDLNHGSSL